MCEEILNDPFVMGVWVGVGGVWVGGGSAEIPADFSRLYGGAGDDIRGANRAEKERRCEERTGGWGGGGGTCLIVIEDRPGRCLEVGFYLYSLRTERAWTLVLKRVSVKEARRFFTS
jgi:hypothetical protein